MKIKYLLIALFLGTWSFKSNACPNHAVDIFTDTYGDWCDDNSVISVYTEGLFSANDYLVIKLQTLTSSGWVTVQDLTTKKASFYHNGPCYTITEEFTVSPTYTGSNEYRAQVDLYRLNGSGSYILIRDDYTGEVKPWGYKPIVLEDLQTVNSEGNAVEWASACISSEFDLSVNALAGPTYYADYNFSVYNSNSSGARLSLINSATGAGENYGDFGTPSGSPFFDWIASDVQPMFQSELSSLTAGGFLRFEIEVENPICGNVYNVYTVLEVRATPYITSFFFEWDDDNNGTTPKVSVPASKSTATYPQIGGLSGHVVSDISTQYYDQYELTVKIDVGNNTWVDMAVATANGIGGAQFDLNPNSATPIGTYTNADLPINNPGTLYRVYLSVSTSGCPSSTDWSYYEVDPLYQYQQMPNLSLTKAGENQKYHYVASETNQLFVKGFGNNQNYDFVVYNIQGQKQLSSEKSVLNIEALAKGSYVIVVESHGHVQYRAKFIR
jgi:hypothetical protein